MRNNSISNLSGWRWLGYDSNGVLEGNLGLRNQISNLLRFTGTDPAEGRPNDAIAL